MTDPISRADFPISSENRWRKSHRTTNAPRTLVVAGIEQRIEVPSEKDHGAIILLAALPSPYRGICRLRFAGGENARPVRSNGSAREGRRRYEKTLAAEGKRRGDRTLHRILVERAWGTGRLHHYYHFIAECLWPLFVWLKETRNLNDGSTIFFADHNVSYFREILVELFDHQFLFPGEPDPTYFDAWRERRTPLFRSKDASVVLLGTTFHAGRMAAFYDETISNAHISELKTYTIDKLRIQPPTKRSVVLIQREKSDEIDGDREKLYAGQGYYDSRGAARRFTDFQLYAEMLERSLPRDVDVRLVKLATMGFRDQVTLFRTALAVVGDHGAGLVNAIWSDPGLVVIEICGGRGLPQVARGRKSDVLASLWSLYRFAATLWNAKRAGVQFEPGNFMHIGIPDLRASTRWHVIRGRDDIDSKRVVSNLISILGPQLSSPGPS